MTSVMFTSCGGKKKNSDTASSDLEKTKIYGFFTGENDLKKGKPITVKELLKAEPLTDADFKVVFTKDKKGVIITDFIGKNFIDKKNTSYLLYNSCNYTRFSCCGNSITWKHDCSWRNFFKKISKCHTYS